MGFCWFEKAAEAAENIEKKIPIPEVTAPAEDSVRSSLGDLYYPGSSPQPGMKQGDNRLYNLQSQDAFKKVKEYYKSKLTHTNVLQDDSDSFSASFDQGGDKKGMIIVVKGDEGKVEIMLAIGVDVPALPSFHDVPSSGKGARP